MDNEYFQRTSQNYYKSKKVKMPKPELYVIFTGNKGQKPNTISLSKEFFEGAEIDIEVKAKVSMKAIKTTSLINIFISVKFLTNRQNNMECPEAIKKQSVYARTDVLKEYLAQEKRGCNNHD